MGTGDFFKYILCVCLFFGFAAKAEELPFCVEVLTDRVDSEASTSAQTVRITRSVRKQIPRVLYQKGQSYLVLEFLYDGLVRFEFSDINSAPTPDKAFFTTPMVHRTDFPGPQVYEIEGHQYRTREQQITVDINNFCIQVEDRIGNRGLTTICADNMGQQTKTLSIDPHTTTHLYGLGQYPTNHGEADGNWVGRVWEPGPMGNKTQFMDGGIPSFSQFPILYALGNDQENYALFLDHPYKQRWDFSRHGEWWKVDTWGDQIRGYLFAGQDVPQLRKRYLDLVGRPPVPPKKIFGLWVSEFGYDNWNELDHVLGGLRQHGFPIDGFALDLQWFGNDFGNADASKMGSLTFDNTRFPNAAEKIRSLKADGIDLMLIEQSYIHHTLPEHEDMANRGYLARDHFNGPPTFIDFNPWWGRGGLIDWTDPAAALYWHKTKRKPLVDMGIRYHWTDLGEPEMYNPWSVYHGIEPGKHHHGDIHNVYNLMWLEGIASGYRDLDPNERFYTLTRAGAPGIQRYGAGMWGGDDGANAGYLSMHMNRHMHMAYSGIDYYSSDTGGFFTWSLDSGRDELFTMWLAFSSLVDFPVRPHVWNLENQWPTSPAHVGHQESNRANILLRYQLVPYYYTLAHQAHRQGEPVVSPLSHYYQQDENVRNMGYQFMIGKDLLVTGVDEYGVTEKTVYLPKGRWVNWHTNETFESDGQYRTLVPLYRDGKFRLPLFAKAGAIIPMAKVDTGTKNVFGERLDGSQETAAVYRVFSDFKATQFRSIEDDGLTNGYLRGEVRETDVWQQRFPNHARVIVKPASGSYNGAPAERDTIIELITRDANGMSLKLNEQEVPQVFSKEEFENHTGPCFWNVGRNVTLAKSGVRPVSEKLDFDFALHYTHPLAAIYFVGEGETKPGESLYISGNIPQLGNWDPAKALKLTPNPYPKWTANLRGIPINTRVEWKLIKRNEHTGEVIAWQQSDNQVAQPVSVYPYVSKGKLD